jgi:hypothetical protein
MSIKDAKDKIIAKVNATDDEHLITEVYKLLGIDMLDFEDKPMLLTDEEISAIEKGLDDIKHNRVISLEDSNKEVDKWLNGK